MCKVVGTERDGTLLGQVEGYCDCGNDINVEIGYETVWSRGSSSFLVRLEGAKWMEIIQ